MSLTLISLPWPAKALSPNFRSRSHWPRTNAIAAHRKLAWGATLQAMGCAATGELLAVTFNPPDRRKRDDDNMIASAKAYRDGIADALGCDDHNFFPEYRFGNPTKGGAVIVEIGGGDG